MESFSARLVHLKRKQKEKEKAVEDQDPWRMVMELILEFWKEANLA